MAHGITEIEVLEAADTLLARGERPTIERVRQELGRGSPNTVNRHLDAWWSTLSQRMAGKDGAGLPAALLELCSRLYGGVLEQAQSVARTVLAEGEALLKAGHDDLEATRASFALERAAAAAVERNLTIEVASLRERLENLVKEKAHLSAETARLEGIAQQAKSEAQRSEAALEALRVKQDAEVRRIRDQWEGNESRWLKEIEHLRDDVKRLRTQGVAEGKALRDQIKAAELGQAAAVKGRAEAEKELNLKAAQLQKEREARLEAEAAAHATRNVVESLRGKGPLTETEKRSSTRAKQRSRSARKAAKPKTESA